MSLGRQVIENGWNIACVVQHDHNVLFAVLAREVHCM